MSRSTLRVGLAMVAGALAGHRARRACDQYEAEIGSPIAVPTDPFLAAVQQHVGSDLVIGYALAIKTVPADNPTARGYVTRWYGDQDTRLGLAQIMRIRAERTFIRRG